MDQARESLGIEPKAVTHNILLDSLLKSGRVEEALDYFHSRVVGNLTEGKPTLTVATTLFPPLSRPYLRD